MSRKKTKSEPMVAARNIAIEGKHFAAGSRIEKVDEDQLRIAVNAGRVVPESEFEGNATLPLKKKSQKGDS